MICVVHDCGLLICRVRDQTIEVRVPDCARTTTTTTGYLLPRPCQYSPEVYSGTLYLSPSLSLSAHSPHICHIPSSKSTLTSISVFLACHLAQVHCTHTRTHAVSVYTTTYIQVSKTPLSPLLMKYECPNSEHAMNGKSCTTTTLQQIWHST